MSTPEETQIHPDDETLAAFADGNLTGRERTLVEGHLAECEECYAIWSGVADWRETDGAGNVVKGKFPWVWRLVAAAAAVVVIFSIRPIRDRFRTDPMRGMINAYGNLPERLIAPRLSKDFPFHPKVTMRDASGEKRSIKGEDKVQSAAVKVIQSSRDPRARGTAYLFLELNDAAVETLEQAVNTNGEDTDLLNDLGAAYFVRHDYEPALKTWDRAWSIKQTPAIAFNRALARHYLKRPDALAAWEQYLKLDRSSGYAAEARDYIKSLKKDY